MTFTVDELVNCKKAFDEEETKMKLAIERFKCPNCCGYTPKQQWCMLCRQREEDWAKGRNVVLDRINIGDSL